MRALRDFFRTMAGRLFLVLWLGMSVSALLATLLAEASRQKEADRQSLVRAADRLQGYVDLLDASSPELRERLLALGGPGIQRLTSEPPGLVPDPVFAAVLTAQHARFAGARVDAAPIRLCGPRLPDFVPQGSLQKPPDSQGMTDPVCRVIQVRLADGAPLRLVLDSPPMLKTAALAVDPLYLSLLALCTGLLSFLAARLASKPLAQLADAADDLGRDLGWRPLDLQGPLEVKRAAQAFNAMQGRLQRHLTERTHMLAAITHDLQTPLTRLRLRLEQVSDPVLRERLVGDLVEMRALVQEGLELARSAATSEQPVALDLDSLLESLAEDAADAGGDVAFEQGCGAVLMLRPLSTQRLLSNLVENAVKYGGSARISASLEADAVTVTVCDDGPGIAEEDLDRVFEPFARLEASRSRSTGGVGLGLTIARMLAEKDGASLVLRNRDAGGLEARVRWEHPRFVTSGTPPTTAS